MILIIDYGSQFTQLIARRIREMGVKALIISHTDGGGLSENHPLWAEAKGIILSGGPNSVFAPNAPTYKKDLLLRGKPTLGICYGLQLINHVMGGAITPSPIAEYGLETITVQNAGPLAKALKTNTSKVWMSHGDSISQLAAGLISESVSGNGHVASFFHENLPIFGFQFHPEVYHSEEGTALLEKFVFSICKSSKDWDLSCQVDRLTTQILQQANSTGPNSQAICALSGGVDSAVAAVLVQRALGNRLHCIFIDNGLLREKEAHEVMDRLSSQFQLNIKKVDASQLFLERLSGVNDPEEKRKIIGKTFIDVFEQEARALPNSHFLVQGTLYTDVIESVSIHGASVTIKSHHNVGGLPEKMSLKLIEPLKELFKDEVRKLGAILGIPKETLWRHPFPGPGLAIRVLGAVSSQRLDILRKADTILTNELKKEGHYNSVWQAFVVLLPVQSVGVMGDGRTYENVAAVRCVSATDGMTADWSRLPFDFLAKVSSRIINEVSGINRVVYDISTKPPATIEWE